MNTVRVALAATLALVPLASNHAAQATCVGDVDLRLWTAESYPSVSGFPAGIWSVVPDGSSVNQTQNGQPTFFYSDFTVMGSTVEGVIRPGTGDDDFIGFALGFEPGDSMSSDADYLLIDWKKGTQGFNFGAPSCSAGTTANVGLAASSVFGIPTADEFWGHTNSDDVCSDLSNGLMELARATNLGATGWVSNTDYTFRFEFGPTNLKVYVDGMLELDIDGTFANGRMAFYNFSQANINYSAFTTGALASCVEYGTGWPGTNGIPTLACSAPPALGTTIDIQVGSSADNGEAACLLFSLQQANYVTKWETTALVAKPYLMMIGFHPLPAGGANFALDIPVDAALCGTKAYIQMFQQDPGASRGISSSRGVELTLGD